MTWEVRQGDALDLLRAMPEESVQCVVTSPPYWGLRDYKTPGQLGLEPTPEEYVAKMIEVFQEVRRVLRGDGTLWLNMGDSYQSGSRGGYDRNRVGVGKNTGQTASDFHAAPNRLPQQGLKDKDLIGMPWRVAFALQADGWWLRSDIIYAKPNPMPESVRDRPTKAHEFVFLLAKSERYFYDQEAVREVGTSQPATNLTRGKDLDENADGRGHRFDAYRDGSAGRNLRTVWTIPTEPFPEAHFATFPRRLVLPCIQAGTSARGCCANCGAPWERLVERTGHVNTREAAHVPGNTPSKVDSTGWAVTTRGTECWRPTCYRADGKPNDCIPLWDPVPCTVLDPFCGSGTVGVVATQLGRHFIGIDLSPEYCEMARRRIQCPEAESAEPLPEGQLALWP